jgi:hypothetical protein
MRVYYEETYGKYYDIDASTSDEATKELDYRIREGKEDGSEECIGSVTVPLISNGDPQYQIMGSKIDSMDDHEKEFYLWHLLRFYYSKKLRDGKEKSKDDAATIGQINRLIENVNELDTLICYDLF